MTACKHNFILVRRGTTDIPVPYLKCSRCGEVRSVAHLHLRDTKADSDGDDGA